MLVIKRRNRLWNRLTIIARSQMEIGNEMRIKNGEWGIEWEAFDEKRKNYRGNNNKNKQQIARCNKNRFTDQDLYVCA